MTMNKVNNKNSRFIYENPIRINKIILLIILTIFSGCKKPNLSKSEMTKYLYDESNGFSITKNTDIFKLNLTYFPAVWRALNEKPSSGDHTNYKKSLDKSLLFVFTISPLEGKSDGDVFLSGVNSKQDYEERVRKANFGFVENWTLTLDNGTELNPIGVQMEQTNGLTNHRKFQILFDISKHPTAYESKIWDLMLDDVLFNSGIHHFAINKEDRDNLTER